MFNSNFKNVKELLKVIVKLDNRYYIDKDAINNRIDNAFSIYELIQLCTDGFIVFNEKANRMIIDYIKRFIKNNIYFSQKTKNDIIIIVDSGLSPYETLISLSNYFLNNSFYTI